MGGKFIGDLDEAAQETGRDGTGAGRGGLDEARGVSGTRSRRDGGDENAERRGPVARERLGEVGGGVFGGAGDERGLSPVIGRSDKFSKDGVALRGRGGSRGGFVAGERGAAHGPRKRGELRRGGEIFLRETERSFFHVHVGAGLNGAEETREVFAIEGDGGQNFGVLVLHAPDAGKVVVAIGPDGGVGRAVQRAAGVVVNDGLVVEIDDVERAVRADAVFNGAEPQIGAANKFLFFAALFFFDAVADAIAADELVVDDVERGLAGEVAVIPFFRPGAAFVNRATRGGGEAADLVDLRIGLLGPRHRGERELVGDHPFPGRDAGEFALGQNALGENGVEKHRAARGLRPKHLTIPSEIEPPGVAVAAAVLLEGGTVGLEAHDAGAVGAEFFRAVGRSDVAARVTVRGVDPAVAARAQIVNDGVSVVDAEAGVEFGALVADAVAVGVFEVPNIGRGGGDHAVAVKDEAGDELEFVGEGFLGVHDPVAVGVRENRDGIFGVALGDEGFERTGILPTRGGIRHAAAVGIFGRLADPKAAAFIPVDVHDFVDERLGGDEGDFEIGVNLDFGGGLARRRGTAFRITQRVAEFGGEAEFVGVGAAAGPSDAAQENRAVIGAVKIFIEVTGD